MITKLPSCLVRIRGCLFNPSQIVAIRPQRTWFSDPVNLVTVVFSDGTCLDFDLTREGFLELLKKVCDNE